MDILDILRQAQGGNAVANLARAFGITPAEAGAVLESVVPQLSQRLERNTLSRGGVADLVGAIGRAADRGYLDDPKSLGSTAVKADGIGFLDQILWSKDRSRAVAHRAAQSSGLSEALIKQMLPVIAAMVMEGIAKGAAGGLKDILGRIPGLPGAPPGAGPPELAPVGGGTEGGMGGQSPLPLPGERRPGGGWGGGQSRGPSQSPNPYDDLSDVIRRGGQSIPGSEGGTLASIIRGILGAVLGFQSRGLLGWILRFVVLRYGMGIVRWFFSRLLGGRRV